MVMEDCQRRGYVRRFHAADDPAVRLACFPHAGGSASYYFPVSRTLCGPVEVLAMQYPGRLDRLAEPHIGDVCELAEGIADDLSAWYDRPLALFGHSLGATVAFEVARLLQSRGTGPLALFVSGCQAPSRQRRDERVHLADDAHLMAVLERLGGTDPAVLADEDLARALLPTIRSDYRAAETYRYRPGAPLRCPITVLNGDRDPQVSAEDATAWVQHTTARCRLRWYPGGHFYLNRHRDRLLAQIRTELAEALDKGVPVRR
jgi:surfactin synthase thioesterase subunit